MSSDQDRKNSSFIPGLSDEGSFGQSEALQSEDAVSDRSPLKEWHLNLPLDRHDLTNLRAGDVCYLSGPLYTLRDAGHERLLSELDATGSLPYSLCGQTIFYAGPTPPRAGRPFGAIGPTTASRMDFATPTLLEAGIVATIGKGKRSEAVHDACKATSSVYFVATGGAAAFLAKCIESSETLAYHELGTEALRKVEVLDFPVLVGIDCSGRDIYSRDR